MDRPSRLSPIRLPVSEDAITPQRRRGTDAEGRCAAQGRPAGARPSRPHRCRAARPGMGGEPGELAVSVLARHRGWPGVRARPVARQLLPVSQPSPPSGAAGPRRPLGGRPRMRRRGIPRARGEDPAGGLRDPLPPCHLPGRRETAAGAARASPPGSEPDTWTVPTRPCRRHVASSWRCSTRGMRRDRTSWSVHSASSTTDGSASCKPWRPSRTSRRAGWRAPRRK